jgi:hypothetical protein
MQAIAIGFTISSVISQIKKDDDHSYIKDLK